MRSERGRDRGMTLIEILVVLALLSLIATAIGVAVTGRYREGQLRTARLQVREVSGQVQQFIVMRNHCPTLDELITARFVRAEPRDPWGSAVTIRCPGEHDPDGVDVASLGPDKRPGTDDDVVSWTP